MTRLLPLLCILGLVLMQAGPLPAAETALIAFGDPFPELELPVPKRAEDRAYLGLPAAERFTPSQVKADLLLVELLNVHCVHCQMQAPAYNELYRLLDSATDDRSRIRLFGIAIGNLPEEVEQFRTTYGVPFPILADPRFTALRALGARSTPFAVYVRQDRPGQPGVVADTHLGLNTDYLHLRETLRRLAETDLATLRAQGAQAVRTRTAITPLYTDEELETRVRMAFINTGGQLESFVPLLLRSGRRVYAANLRRGEQRIRLYAEATSRQSVCDICHDVHFVYVFEPDGRIVGFEPLQITKYGNLHWTREDAAKMRRRVVGQYLSAPRPFDPKLDAVSSATISSAMIFDSIGQGEALLAELRERGYLR